jgi:hypothetical protein
VRLEQEPEQEPEAGRRTVVGWANMEAPNFMALLACAALLLYLVK